MTREVVTVPSSEHARSPESIEIENIERTNKVYRNGRKESE